ncbi:hypothetical protein A2801_01200 [Candidatus Woesebacteria bacterium RIFCSPHIGHO2_01_FULL_41_10]|uniref:Uncharacterized protein n=1 Tax=Candidatus Woesebacteria bacterium RIFCSPHIGHO2_01_FULL_41_10 TaxID=1802500 RepID=A0A1F7YSG5_9BACT|nr:MAG: hypothetical protein A2801_01200 [Candidatus Woesebacteria bacterium RIFCSPHIGHO2_01_FULL_41_10]
MSDIFGLRVEDFVRSHDLNSEEARQLGILWSNSLMDMVLYANLDIPEEFLTPYKNLPRFSNDQISPKVMNAHKQMLIQVIQFCQNEITKKRSH